MIGEKNVGDVVRVLGEEVELDWIGYVREDFNAGSKMDDWVDQSLEIVEKTDDYRDGHPAYKIEGCPWWWASEWLCDPDDRITNEDFDSIID